MKDKIVEILKQYKAYKTGGLTHAVNELLNLHIVSCSAIDVLKQIAECPNNVDSATVPKAGIEAAPEQVVINVSISYKKYKQLQEVLKHCN